jgi:glucose/mannose transport system substrate-binding protein
MKTALRNRLMGGVALLVATAGCAEGSDPGPMEMVDPPNTETRVLKVASQWFSASEQEALQVVLNAFEEETGATVEVVALGQSQTERTQQYQTSDWDVGQDNFFNIPDSFDDGDGGYTALDLSTVSDLAPGLALAFPKVHDALVVDGKILGVPMNLHRENTLHYATSVQNPPTTLEALRAMCDTYVAGGKTGPKPLAIARGDWLYRILFQSMLPPDVMSATSDDPRASFLAASEVIEHYLDNDCLWVAPEEHGWQQAAQALVDNEALMYVHGDWAKGYLVQLGFTPGVDFNVAPAPGSNGAFYYGIDTFSVNKGSPRLDLAIKFARIALDPEVQAGFSTRKGSTPGLVFEDPDSVFADRSLATTYAQLETSMQDGTALPVPPWLGNEGPPLLVPLRDGERTPEQVASDFMTVYPTSP